MLGMIARPFAMAQDPVGGQSAASAQFPVSNLVNNDYGRVFRSASGAVTSYSWCFDLGAVRNIDAVGALWHNLRAADQIRIGAGNTAAAALANTGYSSGFLSAITGTTNRDAPVFSKFLLTPAQAQAFRYWSLSVNIVGSVHPDGYTQMSRLFFGQRQIFQIGPQRAEFNAVDTNQRIQIETGDERVSEDPLLIKPVAALDFAYAKESEMSTFMAQYTMLGVSLPMLIVPDLTAAALQDQIIFGRPEQVISLQSEVYDVWKFQARVRSLGP